MAETTETTTEKVIVVNDTLDLQGAPHTVCEIARETFSTLPEMTEKELYAQPEEEKKDEENKEDGEEGEKTPEDKEESDPTTDPVVEE